MQSLPAIFFSVAHLSLCQKIGGYGDSKVPKFTQGNWSQFFVTTKQPMFEVLELFRSYTYRSRVIELPQQFPI